LKIFSKFAEFKTSKKLQYEKNSDNNIVDVCVGINVGPE
jgi:hypothetical protein